MKKYLIPKLFTVKPWLLIWWPNPNCYGFIKFKIDRMHWSLVWIRWKFGFVHSAMVKLCLNQYKWGNLTKNWVKSRFPNLFHWMPCCYGCERCSCYGQGDGCCWLDNFLLVRSSFVLTYSNFICMVYATQMCAQIACSILLIVLRSLIEHHKCCPFCMVILDM